MVNAHHAAGLLVCMLPNNIKEYETAVKNHLSVTRNKSTTQTGWVARKQLTLR